MNAVFHWIDRHLGRIVAGATLTAAVVVGGVWVYWHYPQPRLVVTNAVPIQTALLRASLADYATAGYDMPPLHVIFHDDCGSMDGASGITLRTVTHAVIDICANPGPHVMSHELAHAWLDTHLSAGDRNAYAVTVGLPTWRSHRWPWNQRASELAAEELSWGVSRLTIGDLNIHADWATLAFGYAHLLTYTKMAGAPPTVDRYGNRYTTVEAFS